MSEGRQLVLEVLSGPLDGHTVTLDDSVDWSRAGEGRLAFPWDEELGQPQARFTVGEGDWWLEGLEAPHGTYRVKQGERIMQGKIQLAEGDVLKASDTWLLVCQVK